MENKYTGLSKKEVEYNQNLYGKNEITYKDNKFLEIILNIIKQPIIYILITCLIIYIVLGKLLYAGIVGSIDIIIIINYIYQHIKTEKIKKQFKKINAHTCNVIRDSKIINIKVSDITIDDIILFNKGDRIGADAIILESHNLYTDESLLIEGNKKVKKSYDLLDKNAELKSNYVYAGTYVISGSGIAKVTNIGKQTEYAKKNQRTDVIENDGELQKNFNKQYLIFNIIALILLITMTIISIINNNVGIGILFGITTSISFVSIINTPNTFKLYLYNNILKFAKNNAVIKKTSTLDTTNKLSCICVDKLGIITENNIIVKDFYPAIEEQKALTSCLLSCANNSNDLYEKAISDYISKNNMKITSDFKLIKSYPFTKETKIMANIYEYNNQLYIFVKGTLNALFDICNLDVEEKYKLHNFQKQLFKKGLEVIAFASQKIDKIESDIFKYNVNFNGIITLYNPPKVNVKEAIEICKNLNIKTIMISEDKKEIASFCGKEIGINTEINTIPGKELNKINDKELLNKINNIDVFSRIKQDDKYRILSALKKNNNIVAFTGNTVEDVNLLNETHLGISMKGLGNDISNDISELIILDDNFTTIVNTINNVKKIYCNTKKLMNCSKIISIILSLILITLVFTSKILLLPIIIIILKIILELITLILFTK